MSFNMPKFEIPNEMRDFAEKSVEQARRDLEVLGAELERQIEQDKKKLREGHALMMLFCKPQPFKHSLVRADFASVKAYSAAIAAARDHINLETYILAWDPVKAKEVWRIKNDIYGSSGILATSGNLIFSGNHNGEFAAYDSRTGKELWTAPTQARVDFDVFN